MKKSTIACYVSLYLGTLPLTLFAAESDVTSVEEVEKIEITGSRIKRTELEGVSPVLTLSAEDIALQGHANVFDAINSISMNTGAFVGEENSNNFNANAKSVNLRGFGAGYTLTLVNGKRFPILPKPSDSVAGNVVNLAMIPTEAVKRVEILSGGASAIYGSDAVAGVINVILKDDVDFNKVSLRLGDTKDGGGASKKFTISSGGTIDKFSYTAMVEIDQMDPIHGDDRDWFDEPTDGPDESRHNNSQVMSYYARWQPDPWMLIDLSDECDVQGYSKEQPSWVTPFEGDPYFCGDNTYGTRTIRNERDTVHAFANLEYELDDGRLFATLMGTHSEADAGLYRYSYAVDYDVRTDLDDWSTWQGSRHAYRQFQNHEVPTSNQEFEEQTLMGIFGIEGVIADKFDYSFTLTASQYDYKDSVVRFEDEKMLSLMFGEKGTDWDFPWEGSRWIAVEASQLTDDFKPTGIDFFGNLTPEMFDSAAYTSYGDGKSSLYSLAFDLSGSIVELPAGDLQFAFVTEAMQESYQYITDDKTVQGDIYGWSGITGKGERNRYSAGIEFLIPLAEQESTVGLIEAKAAGRYDYYDDESNVDGAFTYQAGLSWKPIEEVLVRTLYSTSFRAPDMHYMYAGQSSSFTSSTDYLDCVEQEGISSGESWGDCSDNYGTGSIRQYSQGDLSLEEETGDSFSFGVVADITDNWAVTADYYELSLEKKVGVIGSGTVLRYEAECTVGFTEYDETVDTNSPKCQEMLGRVERGGPQGGVLSTVTSPFNTGVREQKGIDITSAYNHDFGNFGNVFFNVNYTHILETNSKFLPEDELESIRDAQWNNEFRTLTNATLGWYNDTLSVALFANRQGTSPVRWSEDETERYDAWTRVNLNVAYHVTDDLLISATVNNLFDEKPPQHESEKWWPFADITKYNPVGMEYFITASYTF